MSTDPKSVAADIARELREHPERWTKGTHARGSSGDQVDYASRLAKKWCLAGHICKRVGMGHDWEIRARFREILGIEHTMWLSSWNDEPLRTVTDIIAACDKVATS